ncbi:MAG: BtrH N-terminal domain-containing protein [Spirochaetes bacterium]|nr:BtrH N-terminal domain-containing protein [Spirochaetota bacterium]
MMKPAIPQKTYTHYQGGHCESGTVSSIVKNYGFDLSEPMAFGISSNIGFVYLPFIKVWGRPLLAWRMIPQSIVRGVQKRLGIRFCIKTYDNEQDAMDELDRLLDEGRPVGLQVSVAYLTYFLGNFRIPFNGHMTIVNGREGDEYIVSDPLYDNPVRVHRDDLRKARFARGPNAPKGFLFYPLEIPETIDYKKAIRKAVKHVPFMMLQPMFPYYGILGIKTFARKFRRLKKDPDRKRVRAFISHVVIFQEEQGTGGGGFRYMYAAFLREAYDILKIPELLEASKKFNAIGDLWRQAAATCGKFIQGKTDEVNLDRAADIYMECAREEKEAYLLLKRIKWN